MMFICLGPFRPRLGRGLYQSKACASKSTIESAKEEEKTRESNNIAQNASLEEPPTTCCGTGCANCVYIVWAEALAAKMKNCGPEVTEKILKSTDDPSLKAYLEMELRLRGLKK